MTLYLINISVDAADPFPDHIPEDLSYNDQESLVEIVLEQILGIEDAIIECEDHDIEGQLVLKLMQVDFLLSSSLAQVSALPPHLSSPKHPLYHHRRPSDGFLEIASPPPKV